LDDDDDDVVATPIVDARAGRVDAERAAFGGIDADAGSDCCSRFNRDDGRNEPAAVLLRASSEFVFVALISGTDSGCSRFKSDGAKEPVTMLIVLVGELELKFVALDDAKSAMAGTKDIAVAAASPQHQSPCFHFLLLSSLVVWFIVLRYD